MRMKAIAICGLLAANDGRYDEAHKYFTLVQKLTKEMSGGGKKWDLTGTRQKSMKELLRH